MTNQSKILIKDLQRANGFTPGITNTPGEYADFQTRFMAHRGLSFINERSKYSSNFVHAQAQGLSEDFYSFVPVSVRLSDLYTGNGTSANSKKYDDCKKILFVSDKITYFPIGAKLKMMGSTWLCVNPDNISSPYGCATIIRCNTSYNCTDEYGNIIKEPIAVENAAMSANNNSSALNIKLAEGYFNVICQLNAVTKKLSHNKRIIIGSNAYSITGFSDFIEEFSNYRNTSHLMMFTARLEETTENDDTDTYFTADGKHTDYQANIFSSSKLRPNETCEAHAVLYTNGQKSTLPTSWIWESTNPDIADISGSGLITAHNPGTVNIKATLNENKKITAVTKLTVCEKKNNGYIKIESNITEKIPQYQTATLKVLYCINGASEIPAQKIVWKFWGASEDSFSVDISSDSLSASVFCLKPCEIPLSVCACANGISTTVMFKLEGY